MAFILILRTFSGLPLSLWNFPNLLLWDTRKYLRSYGWLLLCKGLWEQSVPTHAFQDCLDLYFNQEINLFVFCKLSLSLLFLRSKELSFCIGKNRSFRDSPRLFLLSSNAIATDRLSKQSWQDKKNADDSPTWNTVLSTGHSMLNSR